MCVASTRTVTAAQMAMKALAREGISSELVSIDPSVTKNGCAFGISFSCSDEEKVRRILNKEKVPYGVILGSNR